MGWIRKMLGLEQSSEIDPRGDVRAQQRAQEERRMSTKLPAFKAILADVKAKSFEAARKRMQTYHSRLHGLGYDATSHAWQDETQRLFRIALQSIESEDQGYAERALDELWQHLETLDKELGRIRDTYAPQIESAKGPQKRRLEEEYDDKIRYIREFRKELDA